MNWSTPRLRLQIQYPAGDEQKPYRLKIYDPWKTISNTGTKWIFYEEDLKTVEILYWIVQTIPNQIRKYIYNKCPMYGSLFEPSDVPFTSLKEKLDRISISEEYKEISTRGRITVEYFTGTPFRISGDEQLINFKEIIEYLQVGLDSFQQINYEEIGRYTLQDRVSKFLHYCKHIAWSLFVFKKIFKDLPIYYKNQNTTPFMRSMEGIEMKLIRSIKVNQHTVLKNFRLIYISHFGIKHIS